MPVLQKKEGDAYEVTYSATNTTGDYQPNVAFRGSIPADAAWEDGEGNSGVGLIESSFGFDPGQTRVLVVSGVCGPDDFTLSVWLEEKIGSNETKVFEFGLVKVDVLQGGPWTGVITF